MTNEVAKFPGTDADVAETAEGEETDPWKDSGAYTPPIPVIPKVEATKQGKKKLSRWIAPIIGLGFLAIGAVAYVATGPHSFASLGAQEEAFRNHWPSPHRGGTSRLAPLVDGGPSRDYAVTKTEGGASVGYNPCEVIHYVIRETNAPAGGDKMIQDAVARTAQATGLVFAYDGTTTEPPMADRAKYQKDRYGDRWAPVLISWTTPEETPAFTGDIAGFGGSSPVQAGDGPWIYVTGQVQLDGPLAQQLIDKGSATQVESMFLHEMGHVVGLPHAEKRRADVQIQRRFTD